MSFQDLPLIFITRTLEPDLHIGEALFFPEILALDSKPERLNEILRDLVREIARNDPPLELHRRLAAGTAQIDQVTLELAPPKVSTAWSTPLSLRFHLLRWEHGDQASIAYIPALGIEVVAPRPDQLDKMVVDQIRLALARTRFSQRLFDLIQLQRIEGLKVEAQTISIDIRTPREIAAEEVKEDARKPVIEDVGVVFSESNTSIAWGIDELVGRIADTLVGRTPRSVLLVGPSGVGKTAAVQQLFRVRHEHGLAGSPFWSTGGARLVAGASGFGAWQERCQRLAAEARSRQALLHLGNLVELMEVGKAGGSTFGIASFFRPFLARGDFLAIAECTPEQLPLIERGNPHLLAAFHVIHVEEPSLPQTRMILHSAALQWAGEHNLHGQPISDRALDTLVRLHQRYATYSASPGRPLRFLRDLLGAEVVDEARVTAAFSRETGLPLFLLDEQATLDLSAARQFFGARVIGQEEGVDLVIDLLATVKAALNRPRRPIASLLFIGPTGVGKTEMAKALADYFFGNAPAEGSPASGLASPRLVRFDMSEYSSPAAVARLLGNGFQEEGLLTAKIREQPFCVLLLDEFEKADGSFFDLLLQVLGEGRLTDSSGRLADFSNAIVVMTSNLGAQAFQSGPFGLSKAQAHDAREHFTDAVRSFLRPELFNRIDRVVPFMPLDRATIERITQREIALIMQRDGIRQRDIRFEIAPEAVAHLADAGYHPLYGARPLKRRIERDLLAPLSDAINQYADGLKLSASVGVGDGRLRVAVRAAPTPLSELDISIASAIPRVQALRRNLQAVGRCTTVLSLGNELFNLRRSVERQLAHPRKLPVDPAARERLKRLESIEGTLNEVSERVIALEDALLGAHYESLPLPFGAGQLWSRHDELAREYDRLLLQLYGLHYGDPHTLTLAIFSNAHADMFEMARGYRDAALSLATPVEPARVAVSWFSRHGKSSLQRNSMDEKDANAFLSGVRDGVIGIALQVHAPFALPLFETETGLHVFEEEKDKHPHPLLVDTTARLGGDYRPPRDVEFRVALVGQRRRTYVRNTGAVTDAHGGTYRYHPPSKPLSALLLEATRDHLSERVKSLLDG